MAAIFPNTLTAQIQALRLVALSLTLSHGREDGVAVGIKGSARKTGCIGCFLLFRRPAINGCKSKLFFKLPATAKIAATCSLPRGGGLERGHSPNCSNLSQHPNLPNTNLAVCCPLSSSLPRERGRSGCWIKGSARKIGCACCFFSFQTTYNQRQPQESRRPHIGCVRYARTRSPFSLQPQPTACVPCGTRPTDGFKGRLKKRLRRLFHLPCDKGYLKNSRC